VQERGGYDRNRFVDGCANHSTVSDRANGTLVTGEPGIVSVDVDSLGEAAEGNEKDCE